LARLEGRATASEQAQVLRSEQISERLKEASELSASGLARVRSEALQAVAGAVGESREGFKEEMRSLKEGLTLDVQATREEFRSSLAASAEREHRTLAENRAEMSHLEEEARANSRELLQLVEELQQQISDTRSDARRCTEDSAGQLRSELQACADELQQQLSSAREDSCQAQKQLKLLTETATSLEDSTKGTQRALGEVASAAGTAQARAEEAGADGARLQAFVEAGFAELRREVRSNVQQASTLERHLGECREELQRQAEVVRSEALKSSVSLQKESAELSRRIDDFEQSQEEAASRSREQVREVSRSSGDRINELEERLQGLSQQIDLGLISVRHEMARIAGAAQDLAPEVEQACRRIVGEEAQVQVEKWNDALNQHKQAAAEALAAAVAEPRADMKALRVTLSEAEAESAARVDRMSGESQRQVRSSSSKTKQDLDDLSVNFEERLASVSSASRQLAMESRQEVARQLQPLSEKVSEAASNASAARRAQAELTNQCERLMHTTEQLCAGQEVLSLQTSETAQNLSCLRSEIQSIGCRDMMALPSHSIRAGAEARSREPEGRTSSGSAGAQGLCSTSWSAPDAMTRLPEEPVTAVASAVSRSRSQSPNNISMEKSQASTTDASAFSRLGELRKRLGSQSPGGARLASTDGNTGASNSLTAGLWGSYSARSAGGAATSPPVSPSQAAQAPLAARPLRGRSLRPPNLASSGHEPVA